MRFFFVSLALLGFVAARSDAAILDFGGVGNINDGRFLALDDAGRLWRMSNSCDDWRLVDTVVGARGMEWSGNVGAIVTATDLLKVQLIGLDFENLQFLETIPLPASNIADVGIHHTGSGTSYWLWDDAGRVWAWRGSVAGWFGPCDGPPGAVLVRGKSFGSIKGAYRD